MRTRLTACLALLITLLGGCGRTPPPAAKLPKAPPSGLAVHFLDVGQGDAALIQWDDRTALIDAGPAESEDVLLADLQSAGVHRIDWIIATHPHADHIGGLPAVLQKYAVGHFVDSGYQEGSPLQNKVLSEVRDRGITFEVARGGQTLDMGDGVTLHILAPVPALAATASSANDSSIVARLDFGRIRVLFTGDMEDAERFDLYHALTSSEGSLNPLRANVLKVAHHGSRNGTDAAFLRAVRPRCAVISCAAGNDYGHPHAEALNALRSAGVSLYRTDLQGNITLLTDGRTLRMVAEHPARSDIWTAGRRSRAWPTRHRTGSPRKRLHSTLHRTRY